MVTPGWVNRLILKQTSKISYSNWVLNVTIFSVFAIEHKGTRWDRDISLTWILPKMAVKVGHADCKVFKLAEETTRKASHAKCQETQLYLFCFACLILVWVVLFGYLFVVFFKPLWATEEFLRNGSSGDQVFFFNSFFYSKSLCNPAYKGEGKTTE